MPLIKKRVPRFGSLQYTGPRKECDPERQAGTRILSTKRRMGVRKVNVKTRPVLKVKLPKLSRSRSLAEKVSCGNKTPEKWILEPTTTKTRITGDPGGETQRYAPVDHRKPDEDTDSVPANGSVYFSTQGSEIKPTNQKERAKLLVLRTMSRMVEENRLIRQRLVVLTQAS